MTDKLFTKRLRDLTDEAIRESLAEISVEFEKRFGPAALTASTPVVEREARTEYGWLIERDDPQGLLYRMASRFDRDHMKALRFARREDAQAFCDAFLTDHRHTVAHPQYTRIAEHAWD